MKRHLTLTFGTVIHRDATLVEYIGQRLTSQEKNVSCWLNLKKKIKNYFQRREKSRLEVETVPL